MRTSKAQIIQTTEPWLNEGLIDAGLIAFLQDHIGIKATDVASHACTAKTLKKHITRTNPLNIITFFLIFCTPKTFSGLTKCCCTVKCC